ncbi:hypothetical protein BN2476_230356 [Paraburkholderia piptadeniae]|uniref:Uncharacterized protein n=1 Tax=Paraburkholderia piptadeniae TaxID=1701573 RepID=A0A1N7RY23_9BURK|nr:hypothetical protein BN2476_230356 [Paraburkholderia piptadeniae]
MTSLYAAGQASVFSRNARDELFRFALNWLSLCDRIIQATATFFFVCPVRAGSTTLAVHPRSIAAGQRKLPDL